jgi:multidrug efflux pump subunit AcrB
MGTNREADRHAWRSNRLCRRRERRSGVVRPVQGSGNSEGSLAVCVSRERLQDQGLTVVDVRQTVQMMSAPMKELESLVLSGRFHHDGDPVLAWMA